MVPPLLTLEDMFLTFGGDALFTGVSLSVHPHDRIALVGRNGSGKSTLMKIIAGPERGGVEADSGVRYRDPGATILYLPQEPDFTGFSKVEDYLQANEPGFTQGAELHQLTPYMDALEISGDLEIDRLSGGEARRVALVRALACDPDILLLDEPTNHLDIGAIEWLEGQLKRLRSALVIISHDRQFLENLTDKTLWIDRGCARARNAGFNGFETWRDKVLEEEEAEHHKLGRKIVAEEHWVRYGVTARRKRNVRRMKELQDLRAAHKNARRPTGTVNFSAHQSAPSGKAVIEATSLSKSFADRTIVEDFSIRIARGERIGLIGKNGAGKTTLLNMLIGTLPPDSGQIKIGTAVDVVTLDQRRASLKPGMRVADAITDGRGDFVMLNNGKGELTKKHVASYLKDFLFTQEQWRSPVEALSGGERGRLVLAAALAKPSNLLVLDEPTNDLDLETLDLLQDMLGDYQGTLILVSHDRSFLDRTVTSVIAHNNDDKPGVWTRHAGGYSDMKLQHREALKDKRQAGEGIKSASQAVAKTGSDAGQLSRQAKASKLSYKEKYALETLPKEMETLEAQIKAAKKILEDTELFQRDADKFQKTANELDKAQARLSVAEEQWLELEVKREALEG